MSLSDDRPAAAAHVTVQATVHATEHRDGALIEDLSFPDADGDPVAAFLVRPEGPSPAEHGAAAVLAWHWFDTEAPDGDRTQFRDEAVELASLGVVSLLPQGRFPWARPPTGSAADAAAIRGEVARLRRGLDLLAAHPAVDPGKLGLVGHDFGGMLATVAAAEEDRLRALVLIAATPRWGDWFLPFWPIAEDRIDYLRAIRPLDPIERIGDAAPAAVLFQFGRRDFFIAPMSGLEFRGAAPDGSELKAYDAEHDMRTPEIRADRRAFLARHLGFAEAASEA
jgi:dienelactone hydrolase